MTSPTSDRRQGLVGNTPIKAPVDCATTSNIVLSGEQVIDGVQTADSRVLVHNQTDATQNGIYNSSSAAWTRTADADGNYDLTTGTLVGVVGGSTQATYFYQLTTPKPITIGSSALNWSIALSSNYFNGTVAANPLRELQTASAGQTVITFATLTYVVGNHSLVMTKDGLVVPETDYVQTSPTSVTFSTPFVGGEEIEGITNSFSTFGSGKVAASHTTTSVADFASFQFRRNVEYSGGTPGSVNGCIRADTYVDNAAAAAFEWAIIGVVHNQATAGQNVGGYFQGIKYANAGPTWGSTSEVIDQGPGNPLSGVVGHEVDVSANGTDNNSTRVISDFVYRRQGHVGSAVEVAYGLRFNSDDPDVSQATLKTAIGFTVGARVGIVLDCSPATIISTAIKLNTGQNIQFASSGTAVSTRQMFHNGSGLILQNTNGDPAYWQLGDSGALIANGKQLLGSQVTGYALMTGTLNRATVYDTSTITLQQLAQRFAAFQNDVMNFHGFIHV